MVRFLVLVLPPLDRTKPDHGSTTHEVREGVVSQRIGNLLTGGLMENTLIGVAEDWEPPHRRLDGKHFDYEWDLRGGLPVETQPNIGTTTTSRNDRSALAGNSAIRQPQQFCHVELSSAHKHINLRDTMILTETAGIVDTRTTLILIATDAFNKYKLETGGILDETIGFAIDGTTDGIYLVVSDIGSNFGFTNGYCFLERFYSVYDTTNSRVGFAKTVYTYATSN
ncbi:hypothetical protein DFH29DRAFT_1001180 [Suillus ampliporus]|nr:hypothetical protein DFH29DRAFT_1001180 [Suillus ampliporus]